MTTDAKLDIGDQIVAYPEGLGRVAGDVVRVSGDGVALEFTMSEHDRILLERRMEAVLLGIPYFRIADRRAHTRIPLSVEATARTIPSGQQFKCRITEISRGGAFIQAVNRPTLGSEIKIGAIRGRVCRLTHSGFAITLERTYSRPITTASADVETMVLTA